MIYCIHMINWQFQVLQNHHDEHNMLYDTLNAYDITAIYMIYHTFDTYNEFATSGTTTPSSSSWSSLPIFSPSQPCVYHFFLTKS